VFNAKVSQKTKGVKTNAQKKWAVKTRPFGREASIVTQLNHCAAHYAWFIRVASNKRSSHNFD
jgi:hypothetical protein